MADVAENGPLTDANQAISLAKRHLLVRDYNNAVNTLVQACELLVQKHGDTADELAEPYLLYGRALLGLSREESNVLGTAVPVTKDSDDEVEGEDEDEVDEDEKEEKSEVAEKGDTDAASNEKKESDIAAKPGGDNKTDEKKGEELKQDSEKAINGSTPEIGDNKADKTKPADSKKDDKTEEINATDDKKAEEKSKEGEKSDATPGSSKITNGESSSAVHNGDVKENGEDVNEDAIDDEDVDNLEVAWEVLELAKLVLLKRGPPGWKYLAEAHKLLGEVALEGGKPEIAVTDFNACLDLLRKIEPCDPRAIAEIYYQLGLAYSFANEYDSSIEQFREASSLLEARIKELEESKESPKSEDPFYSVEGEIKELKELLPEIEEKISDMKEAKEEACKIIMAGIKEKNAASGCSNGAGSSTNNGASYSGSSSGSSSAKPINNISHLVRKKRKPEETTAEEGSPCKKMSPQ